MNYLNSLKVRGVLSLGPGGQNPRNLGNYIPQISANLSLPGVCMPPRPPLIHRLNYKVHQSALNKRPPPVPNLHASLPVKETVKLNKIRSFKSRNHPCRTSNSNRIGDNSQRKGTSSSNNLMYLSPLHPGHLKEINLVNQIKALRLGNKEAILKFLHFNLKAQTRRAKQTWEEVKTNLSRPILNLKLLSHWYLSHTINRAPLPVTKEAILKFLNFNPKLQTRSFNKTCRQVSHSLRHRVLTPNPISLRNNGFSNRCRVFPTLSLQAKIDLIPNSCLFCQHHSFQRTLSNRQETQINPTRDRVIHSPQHNEIRSSHYSIQFLNN